MKILVDHGVYQNLGDMAILESAVSHLLCRLPDAELHVKDSPVNGRWAGNSRVRTVAYELQHPLLSAVRQRRLRRIGLSRTWLESQAVRAGHFFRGAAFGEGSVAISSEDDSGVFQLRDWVRKFDALYIPGGGDLNDLFPADVWLRCCLISEFRRAGKPVVLTGQQIGPFSSRVTRSSVLDLLRGVNFLGVRDGAGSLELLRGSQVPCEVMGDDSLGSEMAPAAEVEAALRKLGVVRAQFLTANFRSAPYAQATGAYLQAFAETAVKVSRHFGMPAVVVPISLDQGDSDVQSGETLRQLAGAGVHILDDPGITPALAKGILGAAFGALGVSFHFSWFSLAQGVPAAACFAGEYYAQKAGALASFWGDPRIAVPLASPDAAEEIIRLLDCEEMRARLPVRARDAAIRWNVCFDKACAGLRNR